MPDDLADEIESVNIPDQRTPGFAGGVFTDDQGQTSAIQVYSDTCRTQDDAIKQAKIDERVWSIDRCVINKWDQGQKLQVDGKWRVAVCELWGVRLFLKRRIPDHVLESYDWLSEQTAKRKIGTVRPIKQDKKAEPEMMVVGLKDIHLGKYGCEEECGEDTDTGITVKRVQQVVADGQARIGKARNVTRVLLPIGSDFYNVDNWFDTTYAGTQQDTDTRFKKVFRIGCLLMEGVIQQLRTIAPVEYVYCPGNHDTSTSWYLTEWLRATFKGQDDVVWVQNDQELSYHQHGVSLVGLYHGHKIKARKLCEIMPFEQPQAWAETTTREWLTGHRHTQMVESHGGVVARTLPSLSGTDLYHRNHGYTTGPKASEVYYYGQDTGLAGMDLWTAKH